MSGWINVEERLPENEQDVLVVERFGLELRTTAGRFHRSNSQTWFEDYSAWQYEGYGLVDVPLYWMPMPEPPKR